MGNEFDVSLYDLSRAHDVRPLVVNTLLSYLELADVIESTEPFYNEYQFAPLKQSAEILAKFDTSRAEFLSSIFAGTVKAKKWFTIDLNATMHRLSTTRSRIIKALTYLEEQGDLTLKVAGLRQGYRIKTRPIDVPALKCSLIQRFEARERNDVDRVQHVVELAEHSGCIVRHLLHHFGEDLNRNCGHYTSCSGSGGRTIPVTETTKAPQLDLGKMTALRKQQTNTLSTPRQIPRLCCGLRSPFHQQTKTNKHPHFCKLAEVPFQIVMKAAEQVAQPARR